MEQLQNKEAAAFHEATSGKKNAAINVLTILTFIGCAIQLIMVFATKWLMSFAVKVANDPAMMEKMSESQRNDIANSVKMMDLYTQYQIPLVAISLIGIALCFYGALQMRKLKKQGFYAYLVGEFSPLIISLALMGFVQFTGIVAIVMGFGIPILFSVLYALQLKHMK